MHSNPQSCPASSTPRLHSGKLEREAARLWDKFYRRNGDRFFKDRHYFEREFPFLTQPGITVLETGCGAGNTVFPLLELNPTCRVYACDFAGE
jgi:methyltransferase-like protein 6